jgi:ubiquinone/menaquinone biosynthesis C-methylase UbiE
VLDIGCGTGEWLFELAKRHPRLHIHGVDPHNEALHRARVRRNMSSLRQVELHHMDLLQPVHLPDQSIDLVHMQRCTRFIMPSLWPRMLRECARMLVPSGWLVISEMELCEVSSPACLTLYHALMQARAKTGRSMDPFGETMGVAQRLYGMLLYAGFQEVTYDLHTIDLGFMGGDTARMLLNHFMHNAFIVKPLIVQQGILEADDFDELVQQAKRDMQDPDLCGWGVLITAYGRRAEK